MKIVGVADLHGRLPKIPQCDVLVIAGDICPDVKYAGDDRDLARVFQHEWLRDVYHHWEKDVPATHILATPGNHDWVQRFPVECRSRMFIDELVEIDDLYRDRVLKFWFTPWVSPTWGNYVLGRGQRKERFEMIPRELDVLVSHSPAYHVGDLTYGNEHAGCMELRCVVNEVKPRHMFFGHIHEGQRLGREHALGRTITHHASMWLPDTKPVEIEI